VSCQEVTVLALLTLDPGTLANAKSHKYRAQSGSGRLAASGNDLSISTVALKTLTNSLDYRSFMNARVAPNLPNQVQCKASSSSRLTRRDCRTLGGENNKTVILSRCQDGLWIKGTLFIRIGDEGKVVQAPTDLV